MFIGNEMIDITLFWRQKGHGSMSVMTSLEGVPEEDQKSYQKVSFKTKPLTWKEHNDIQRKATVDKGPGMGSDLDWVRYKENKLVTVLKGWDAKTLEGKEIPVNPDNIFKLHPIIAETLLSEYDRITIVGEEERGN